MKCPPPFQILLVSALTGFAFTLPQLRAESASVLKSASYDPARQVHGKPWPLDLYISTGDNHWLAQSLPIDSPKSINDTFQFIHDLGIHRVYWRGLEAATWVDSSINRPESARYNEFWKWLRYLYKEVDPDALASRAAKKYGIELWGVATLVDWGSQADVPPFGDWPFNSESKLRIEHPEWVPVDRYGILKQGGVIDFSYPEARKALVDLHMKFMRRDGYAGMVFLTYAENHSMRFQDEFGFNEPVVAEFKKRYKLDPRTQAWTRFASREDWIRLRGEYLTAYIRELKAELAKEGRKLGFFVDPHDVRFPQPWNVPETMRTAGSMYLDLETWVQDKLVDQFLVYGYCAPSLQLKAVKDMLWLTRDTETQVGVMTSGPLNERWKGVVEAGAFVVDACAEESMILERSSNLEMLPLSELTGNSELRRQKVLAQIAEGGTAATAADIGPVLSKSDNVITRRLALLALAKIKAPESVALITKSLDDPEHAVRAIAISALGKLGDPSSAGPILDAIKKHPSHPASEMAVVALLRLNPFPSAILAAALTDPDDNVRTVATRTLVTKADSSVRDALIKGLQDPVGYVAFASAEALGKIRRDPDAVKALITATSSDNPLVSPRAATSLAEVLTRNEPETASLRPEILKALQIQFQQYGKDSKRKDIDWGYRPVGNALIACGPEGEAFLQSLIDNESDDPGLAVNAWKCLYIRKASNSFSEVTEKENAEAFRKRPRILKTARTPVLEGSFDETSVFRPDVTGLAGDASKPLGRWGGLTSLSPAITTEKFASGPHSVKFEGAGTLTANRVPGIDPKNDYALSFQVWREAGGGLTVRVKGGSREEFSLRIDSSGMLFFGGGKDAEPLNLKIPAGKWVAIEAAVSRSNGTLVVKVDDNTVTSPPGKISATGPVGSVEVVSTKTEPAGIFYMDDIQLIDIP